MSLSLSARERERLKREVYRYRGHTVHTKAKITGSTWVGFKAESPDYSEDTQAMSIKDLLERFLQKLSELNHGQLMQEPLNI